MFTLFTTPTCCLVCKKIALNICQWVTKTNSVIVGSLQLGKHEPSFVLGSTCDICQQLLVAQSSFELRPFLFILHREQIGSFCVYCRREEPITQSQQLKYGWSLVVCLPVCPLYCHKLHPEKTILPGGSHLKIVQNITKCSFLLVLRDNVCLRWDRMYLLGAAKTLTCFPARHLMLPHSTVYVFQFGIFFLPVRRTDLELTQARLPLPPLVLGSQACTTRPGLFWGFFVVVLFFCLF